MKSLIDLNSIFLFLIQILIIIPLVIAWIPSKHFSNNSTVAKFLIMQATNSVTSLPSMLRVAVLPNEPFFYQDQNGDIHSGIEYQIIETVAKRLNMTALYQIWHDDLTDYNQLLLKYVRKLFLLF